MVGFYGMRVRVKALVGARWNEDVRSDRSTREKVWGVLTSLLLILL